MHSAVIPSVHSYPAMRLAPQPVHQRYVHPGPLVLGTSPLKSRTPTADRDRTVSRRSEPSSRTTLNGEQPYPWDLLQPQDVMSRHGGAKRARRYGLLGVISLLSPAYLLSVERWPFHAGPPDHYGRLSSLLELSLSQSGGLVPLHSAADVRPAWAPGFDVSHLSYTEFSCCHCEAIVKVHRVFPSDRGYPASSRGIQFR